MTGELKAARTWRAAAADALDTRAEAIEGALLAIDALDGMFDEREEIRDAVRNARNLLATDAANLHKQADAFRETPEQS